MSDDLLKGDFFCHFANSISSLFNQVYSDNHKSLTNPQCQAIVDTKMILAAA